MTKEVSDYYVDLAEKYGWSFETISNMNHYQIEKALCGKRFVTFSTVEQYQAYLRSRTK